MPRLASALFVLLAAVQQFSLDELRIPATININTAANDIDIAAIDLLLQIHTEKLNIPKLNADHDAQARIFFIACDVDGDRQVTGTELQQCIAKEIDVQLPEAFSQDVAVIINYLLEGDLDQNGGLSLPEFVDRASNNSENIISA